MKRGSRRTRQTNPRSAKKVAAARHTPIRPRFEPLEPRVLLNSDWTNPSNPRDVFADGVVVPLDVLNLINELNNPTVISENGELPPLDGAIPEFYYDVNGDGFGTSNDVLVVINALNNDNLPPVFSVVLRNDTGPGGSTNNDFISMDPVLTGTVADDLTGIASLRARIGSAPFATVPVSVRGEFTFDPGLMLDGSDDGTLVAQFTANDGAGNRSAEFDVTFTLDTTSPTLTVTSPTDGGALVANGSLQGTVSGTGSQVEEFRYTFDSNAAKFLRSGLNGAFSERLDTVGLSEGAHSLELSVIDAAGNSATQSIDVTVTPNFEIISETPLPGSNEVGVTVRPQIFFSRAVDPTTLSEDNFFASQSGEKLPATIVPANDGSFAWLFFDEPMPDASVIQVTVDGSTIQQLGSGAMLDADSDGQPGGRLDYDFRTVSLVPLPGTLLSGIVVDPGPDLEPMTADDIAPGPDGQLHTADDVFLLPIEGVDVSLIGLSEVLVTGPDGRFQFDAAPSGNAKLVVDGLSAVNAPTDNYFPEMVMDVNLSPAVENYAMPGMQAIYLPRIRTAILKSVDGSAETMIAADENGAPDLSPEDRQFLTLEVQPNSLVAPDGTSLANGMIGISTVPPELVMDMLPPGVLQHTFDITVQAPGISNFSQPAPMTFPNVFDAAPGSQLNFLSFDHNTGRLVIEGTATVSADGKSVSTDPDTGITHPGWHGLTPPGGCGGSGGDPPLPIEASPDEEVTIHDPVALSLMTKDTTGGNFPGFTWRAPPELAGALRLPPIPGCNVPRHNPNANAQQPFVNVTIEVDGPLADFTETFGSDSAPLQSQSFTLSPGTNETKRFDYIGKSYDSIFGAGGFKALDQDRLYGAQIKITQIEQFPDGRRTRDVYTYYQYRWVDVVDPVAAKARSGNTAVFHKTLADGLPVLGGELLRLKQIDAFLPSGVTTNFDESFISDFDVNNPSTGDTVVAWIFDPTSAGAKSDAIDIEVEDPNEGTVIVGQLQAKGTAIEPTEINVNIAGYKKELKDVILAMRNVMIPRDGGPGAAGDDDGNGTVGNEEYGFPGVGGAAQDVVEVVYPYADNAIISARTVGDDGQLGTADDVTRLVIDFTGGINRGSGTHDGSDNMPGTADDESFPTYTIVSNRFKAEFAGFMPSDRLGAGPDTILGTSDDTFTRLQLDALDILLTRKANELKTAISADYVVGNKYGEAFTFVDSGGDVTMKWQDSFVTGGDDISIVSGSPIYGFADGDRAFDYLETHLKDNDLPIGAKMFALAEGLNPNVTNSGSFGIGINVSWTSNATFAQFVANTVSHEIAHTFGIIDAYVDDGTGRPGTANCNASLNCTPFDLMRSGSNADGDLTFLNENTKLVQASMGAHLSSRTYLKDAVQQYRDTFNLAGGVNGIREQPADIPFGDVFPTLITDPILAINTGDSSFFSPAAIDSLDAGNVAADGAGSEQTQLEIELMNVGLGPLTISSISLTDGGAGFSVDPSSIIGVALDPDGHFSLPITFDPTAEGVLHDTLVITSDAENAMSFAVPLHGTGLAPHPVADITLAASNNFGAQDLSADRTELRDFVTITNLGTERLDIADISLTSGSTSFTLLDIPADLATNPLQVAAGETYQFGAAFHPSSVGLQRALIDIATNDPNNPVMHASAVGTGIDQVARFSWGNDFIALETPDVPGSTVLRTVSDDEGNFEVFLPAETRYHLVVFDPASGLVSHGYGTTAASGRGIDLSANLVFDGSRVSDPDFDGLPGDVEFAIGTNEFSRDTDTDGLDDFAEVEQGLNPLGEFAFPTGIIAALNLPGEAQAIVAEGSIFDSNGQTVYVATGAHGLAVIDASRFDAPILTGQIDLPGSNNDLDVDPRSQIAAVAAGGAGLHLVDVSNPNLPIMRQTVSLPSGASRVEVVDGLAFVASGTVITSIDVATGEVIQDLDLAQQISDLAIESNRLYATTTFPQLVSIDLVDGIMQRRGSVELEVAARQLFVANETAYVASEGRFLGGFSTIDVSDPDIPTVTSGVDDGSLAGIAIAANGSGLAVSVGRPGGVFGTDAIDVVDVSDPADTGGFVTRFFAPDTPTDVTLASGIAFVATGGSGLQVVNYLSFDVNGVAPVVNINSDVADVDPAVAGTQVIAGTLVPVQVDVTDDVQVRNVELLVDGQVVSNDVSFPFELTAVAPNETAESATATLQVRATDTGGNVTLSNLLTVDLVPDTQPPQINNIDPADGQFVGRRHRTVRITFSEPVSDESATSDAFRLFDSDGNRLTLSDLGLRSGGQIVQMVFSDLAEGDYRLEIDESAITDRAGNVLGTGTVVSNFTKQLATIEWINPAGGSWRVPSNWNLGRIPGPTDDVLIDVAGDVTITYPALGFSVRSLVSHEMFELHNGSLTITGDAEFNAGLSLRTTLIADGQVVLNGDTSWLAGRIDGRRGVVNRGTLELDSFSNKSLAGLLQNEGTIIHSDVGDLLVLPNGVLTNTAGGTYDFRGDNGNIFAISGIGSTFNNFGTVGKSAGDAGSFIQTSVLNLANGTVNASSGTLALRATQVMGNGVQLQADLGAVLDLTGGQSPTYEGTFIGSGDGTVSLSSGTLNVAEAGATFDLPEGLWQWTAGTLHGGVGAGLTNQGHLTITSPFNKLLDGLVINEDSIFHDGNLAGEVFVSQTGHFINETGAFYDFGDGAEIRINSGTTSAFTNRGSVRKTQGDGSAHLQVSNLNHEGGTIDVQQGTLALGGSTVTSTGAVLNAQGGATLNLTDGVVSSYTGSYAGSGEGTVVVNSGTFAVGDAGATFDLADGLWQWQAGTVNGGSGAGLTNQGDLTITGPFDKTLSGLVMNAGSVFHDGNFAGEVFARPDAHFINEPGAFYDFGDGGEIAIGFGTTSRFTNRGTVRKTQGDGTAHLHISILDHDSGTFDAQQGTLGLGGRTVSGTGANLNAQAGATLNLTDGVATVYSGTYAGSGDGRVLINSGELAAGPEGASFDLDSGLLEWLAGTLNGGTGLGFTNAGDLTISGEFNKVLDGLVINSGTIFHDGNFAGEVFVRPSGHIINDAAGTYDFGDGGELLINSGSTSTFTNRGSVRKTQGPGTAHLQVSILNHEGGTFEAQQGTLGLGGRTVNSTGAMLNALAGATLNLTDGVTSTYSGPYSGSGDGTVLVNSGVLAVGEDGATFNLADGLWRWEAGSINGGTGNGLKNQGYLTITGSFNKTLDGLFTNEGHIFHDGDFAGDVFVSAGGHLINEADAFYDFGDGAEILINSGATSAFTNRGFVRKTEGDGAAVLQISNLHHEGGTFESQQGRLGIGGTTVTSSGAMLNASAGATLSLTDGVTSTYTGTFTGSGDGAVVVDNGTLAVGPAGATFDLADGLFRWTAGTVDGGTGAGWENLGQLTISGSFNKTLRGLVTNEGSVIHEGDGNGELFVAANARIVNEAGADYELRDNAEIEVGSGSTGTFENRGTVRKPTGPGFATLGPSNVLNTGTIDAGSGRLFIRNITNSGNLQIAAGVTAQVLGTFTQTASGTLATTIAGTPASGLFGFLDVDGPATLAGNFNVTTTTNPTVGDSFNVIDFFSRSGAFTTVIGTDLGGGKAYALDFQASELHLTTTMALQAAGDSVTTLGSGLNLNAIESTLAKALELWRHADAHGQELGQLNVRIGNLAGRQLALAAGNTIWLDDDAAGFGWFIDPLAQFDVEAGQMDLLTVLAHEIGHLLGHGHDGGLMGETLAAGQRHLPHSEAVDDFFTTYHPQVQEHANSK